MRYAMQSGVSGESAVSMQMSAEAHRAQSGRLGRGGGWRSSQEGLDQSGPQSQRWDAWYYVILCDTHNIDISYISDIIWWIAQIHNYPRILGPLGPGKWRVMKCDKFPPYCWASTTSKMTECTGLSFAYDSPWNSESWGKKEKLHAVIKVPCFSRYEMLHFDFPHF